MRWRRHFVPLLVWLLAIGVAGHLFARRASTCELTGVAHQEQCEVAPLTEGRVRLVTAELLEPVKAGQPVVVLEDDQMQAAVAIAAAEAARLRAELAAMENRLLAEVGAQNADQMTAARRYAIDVEHYRLRELELQADLGADRAKLDFLRLQMELLGKLREQRAVSQLKFKSAEADFTALDQRTGENEKALAEVRQDLEQARQRQDLYARSHAESRSLDKALGPFRAAVVVQERRIDELSLKRSLLILKSPLDGIVTQAWHRVGESVKNGEPILTIVAARPTSVIAYVTAAQVAGFQPGAGVRLEVVREGQPTQTAATRVAAAGPMVEKLPVQLWRNPSIPEWGWPVKIVLPQEMAVLCGEIIGVSKP
jgi:membrane fusion protein (multidrug efflux system)